MIEPRQPMDRVTRSSVISLLEPLPPCISPQRARRDREAFERMHGGTATQEELDADLEQSVKALKAEGYTTNEIVRVLGTYKEKVRGICNPEWKRKRKKINAADRRRRQQQRRQAA